MRVVITLPYQVSQSEGAEGDCNASGHQSSMLTVAFNTHGMTNYQDCNSQKEENVTEAVWLCEVAKSCYNIHCLLLSCFNVLNFEW